MSSPKLLSRPRSASKAPGLAAHLKAVADRCSDGATGDRHTFLYIIGAFHDFGKATSYFQEYLSDDRDQSQLTNHSAISGLACYYSLRQAGFDPETSAIGWYVIDRHHSPLINIDGDNGLYQRAIIGDEKRRKIYDKQATDLEFRSEQVQAVYNQLDIEFDVIGFTDWILSLQYARDLIDALGYETRIDTPAHNTCYDVLEAYARLVAADKIAAAGYDNLPLRRSFPEDAVDNYITNRFGKPARGTLDELRETARTDVRTSAQNLPLETSISTITLPTGIGKTFTGLDAAFVLRNRIEQKSGTTPRIIYALPFTAIIDQNFLEFQDVLNGIVDDEVGPDTLLKHHYLSENTYIGTQNDAEKDMDADRALMFTDRWESEIVVTTFVQLLESLLVPSNRQSMKLPNLRNAVIVLDEAQNIPIKYWDLVRDCFEAIGEKWGIHTIAMTATQPALFSDTPELATNSNEYYADLDRVTFEFDTSLQSENHLSHAELADSIANTAYSNPNCDMLIICNTVSSAKQVFSHLQTSVAPEELVYLSSMIRPIDRADRIQSIREQEKQEGRQIVVSTQLVEAGVDIDMDLVVRDFAPLDALVQAAGRCNRNDDQEKGTVQIVQLEDENGKKPGTYIYDLQRLDATRKLIESEYGYGSHVSEAEMTRDAVPQYFEILPDVKQTDAGAEELQQWRFEDASITLIEELLSVDVYVARSKQDSILFEEFKNSVLYGETETVSELKPAFYDRVVSVNVYREESERAELVQQLPLPNTDFEVYYLDADSRQYQSWYDRQTGFDMPEDTISSRMI